MRPAALRSTQSFETPRQPARSGKTSTPDTALAELVGPLLFRRLILGETVDEAFRESVVSDFLAAHTNTREHDPTLDEPDRPGGVTDARLPT
jgi:hypothetical protein